MVPNINGFVNRLLKNWTMLRAIQLLLVHVIFGKNRLHDFKETSFENVDRRRRIADACLHYRLTYEPLAQVS